MQNNSLTNDDLNTRTELEQLFDASYFNQTTITQEPFHMINQHVLDNSHLPFQYNRIPEENQTDDLTISALLKLSDSSGDKFMKRCRFKTCYDVASKRSPFCSKHIGSRVCDFIDCKKYAQGGTSLCISHGGEFHAIIRSIIS